MGVEQEAVCMSFDHTLERARSSHLNKLHKIIKKTQLSIAIILYTNSTFFQEDLAMEYFYGHSYSSSDSKGVQT